jgi:hypothetical protein
MKTKLLSVLCTLLLPLTSTGAINPFSLTISNNPLSSTVATELLGKVYMHHQSLLNNSEVKIIDVQTSERFTSSGNILRTILICSVNNDKLPNEYYAITFNGKDIVDGVMLGHNGDSKILTIKIPRDEVIYRPSPEISFDFNGDTIKVFRTYSFFTTAKGGNWFIKEGTICNHFIVSSGGTIKQLAPTATAIREDGDANYLSKDHKQPTRSKAEGEFFPFGMSVLLVEQSPVSNPLNIEQLNNNASSMIQIIEKYNGNAPETPETLSVMEFAKWSFNLGMRHSNEFLTWIAKNSQKEHFTHFIQAVASDNENNELEWLKENVKNLKDKKARKWWEKWIKNNL